jgi:hypothetical protein
MSLFTKTDLAKILKTGVEHDTVTRYLEEIKNQMAGEILRCVVNCREPYLARLACGTQPLGVAFDANHKDFKIIFLYDDEAGLRDPWYPRALEEVTLPLIPALGESGTRSEVVEIAARIAGINRSQLERLTKQLQLDDFPHESALEMLLLNPRVTEALRIQVLDRIADKYVPQLIDCPADIFGALQGRLSDQVWEDERRAAAAAKRKTE